MTQQDQTTGVDVANTPRTLYIHVLAYVTAINALRKLPRPPYSDIDDMLAVLKEVDPTGEIAAACGASVS